MIDLDKIGATLFFEPTQPPDFYGLAGPVLWSLHAAGIRAEHVDLGVTGNDIKITTTLAEVRLDNVPGQVAVQVLPRAGIQCERVRQICFRLTRRLAELHPGATVLWHTTQERFDASAFVAPRSFAPPLARVI